MSKQCNSRCILKWEPRHYTLQGHTRRHRIRVWSSKPTQLSAAILYQPPNSGIPVPLPVPGIPVPYTFTHTHTPAHTNFTSACTCPHMLLVTSSCSWTWMLSLYHTCFARFQTERLWVAIASPFIFLFFASPFNTDIFHNTLPQPKTPLSEVSSHRHSSAGDRSWKFFHDSQIAPWVYSPLPPMYVGLV